MRNKEQPYKSYKWRRYVVKYEAHILKDEHDPYNLPGEEYNIRIYYQYVKASSIPDAYDAMKEEWINGTFKNKCEFMVIIGVWIDEKQAEYYGDYQGNKISN
jgi:hypothetical protein